MKAGTLVGAGLIGALILVPSTGALARPASIAGSQPTSTLAVPPVSESVQDLGTQPAHWGHRWESPRRQYQAGYREGERDGYASARRNCRPDGRDRNCGRSRSYRNGYDAGIPGRIQARATTDSVTGAAPTAAAATAAAARRRRRP